MLKHATINRTSRAQQPQQQWPCIQAQPPAIEQPNDDVSLLTESNEPKCSHHFNNASSISHHYQSSSPQPNALSCSSSPTCSPMFKSNNFHSNCSSGSLMGSPWSSPSKSQNSSHRNVTNKCASESMIRVFARTLSQDVEYVTLHVNAQTKSNQIIKSLLKKFRLKHRDPNLFYLTLERWIRKDGLKYKSVMLLADEACPLQLQQCCSNPPHNDIKFTLQMRAGALVKIFCSDVVADARYKCLSLSTQTTVDETIELMLHCLNLATPPSTNSRTINNNNLCNHQTRLSGSPSSSGSSNSSSSGIESDATNNRGNLHAISSSSSMTTATSNRFESVSRTSSVTSISSASNMSCISNSITDQYYMMIECKDTDIKRILHPDEYLVDVYQNLLAEAKVQASSGLDMVDGDNNNYVYSNNNSAETHLKQQPDQWFFIKLKQRDDYTNNNHSIKFTNPRQNIPLPSIPLPLSHLNGAHNTEHFVSTAQIEVNRRPESSFALSNRVEMCKLQLAASDKQASDPPPAFILLPPIKPRRRNLSDASSTFGRPLNTNRRRYDPAQLAEDLKKLDVKEPDCGSPVNGLLDCDIINEQTMVE